MMTRRNGSDATKRLGRLSVLWCGFALLMISVAGTTMFSVPLAETLLKPRDNVYGFLGELTIPLLVGPLIVFPLGVSCGRFIVRVLPPTTSDFRGTRSWSVALYSTLIIVLYVIGVILASALGATGRAIDKEISDKEAATMLAGSLGTGLPFAILWASGAIGLLLHRYRNPRIFLARPFALFLRRFSTFADRAVIALILRVAPYDLPVVFLTPTLSQPGDWDPYLVGFAGFKLRHPFRGGPIVIRVQDEHWQEAAEKLIQRAQAILLDTSETSSALRTEAEMLDKTGRWPNTVCLRLSSPEKEAAACPSGVRTIDYTKSWVRAIPRLSIGLLFVLYVGLFFYAILSLLVGSPLALLTSLLAYAMIYYSIFVRPTIDRKAKLALRRVLCAVPVTSEPPRGIGGWLILLVIWLVIVPIQNSYLLLTQYWPIFKDGTWEKLTTPGSDAYHYLAGPMIMYGIIGGLVISILAIATLVLLFRKSKKTAVFAIAFLGIGSVVVALDYFIGRLIAVDEQPDPTNLVFAIVVAAIWIPYLIFSSRVKATFVR